MSLGCGHFFPGFDDPGCVYCGLWLRVPAYRATVLGTPVPNRPPIRERITVKCPMLGEKIGGTPCTTPLHVCLVDKKVCSTAAPCLDAARWCRTCTIRPSGFPDEIIE